MALSGILGKRNLEGFTLRVLPPLEVYDGVATLFKLELANHRRLPSYLLRVELADAATTFVGVPRQTSHSEPLLLTLHGRGLQTLETVRVTSNFPVNFFVRSRPLRLQQEVLVFPAPLPTPATGGSDGRHAVGEQPLSQRGQQGEIVRISDYSGREPLKQIHWKLSARHATLKVKEQSDAASEPVLIDPQTLPGRGLEERLRAAVFLVQHYSRAGQPVGLRLPDRLIPAAAGNAQRLRLLKELALYGRH